MNTTRVLTWLHLSLLTVVVQAAEAPSADEAAVKADLQTAQTELGAILEYWEKLQPECVAKPEPYAGLNVGRAQSELLALGLGST